MGQSNDCTENQIMQLNSIFHFHTSQVLHIQGEKKMKNSKRFAISILSMHNPLNRIEHRRQSEKSHKEFQVNFRLKTYRSWKNYNVLFIFFNWKRKVLCSCVIAFIYTYVYSHILFKNEMCGYQEWNAAINNFIFCSSL